MEISEIYHSNGKIGISYPVNLKELAWNDVKSMIEQLSDPMVYDRLKWICRKDIPKLVFIGNSIGIFNQIKKGERVFWQGSGFVKTTFPPLPCQTLTSSLQDYFTQR